MTFPCFMFCCLAFLWIGVALAYPQTYREAMILAYSSWVGAIACSSEK